MITKEEVQNIALAFEEAIESPHFHKSSFRVRKKIFATLDTEKMNVVVKLTEVDQDIFSSGRAGIIEPVSGGWGKQGWTTINLKTCDIELFKAALTTSYCTVAPKKLRDQYL